MEINDTTGLGNLMVMRYGKRNQGILYLMSEIIILTSLFFAKLSVVRALPAIIMMLRWENIFPMLFCITWVVKRCDLITFHLMFIE